VRPITRFTKAYLNSIEDGARRLIVGWRDPQSYAFYEKLVAGGFAPDAHIDVLPEQRIIYVCVPKSASTRIKMTLSAFSDDGDFCRYRMAFSPRDTVS
jgi:hypothetical protein